MPRIDINFDDVPDQILPIEPGVYTCTIRSAALEQTRDGSSEKIVVEYVISDPANPSNGRVLFDHLGVKFPTQIKRLAKAAGVPVGRNGLEVSDLVGKTVTLKVKSSVYKDPTTGDERQTARVADYII